MLKKGIVIKTNGCIFYKSKIKINCGEGNVVDFKSSKIIKSHITIGGSNNKIFFGANCNIHELNMVIEGNNNEIFIGDNVIMGGSIDIICCYNSKVTIGSNSLFSKEVVIRTWDSHKVYKDNKWINAPKKITISDNVWFCQRSTILNGGMVSGNSIVAFGAVVTKAFSEKNVILGGVPAKVLKSGIRWEK